jgi:nitrite reductase/ring-hydroxylating ferredoxin subunit
MNKLILILLIIITFLPSCKDQNPYTGDCFVPDASVNATINMELPQYYNLRNLGEYIQIDQGNNGVYLIHNYDDLYYALERTCTYESERECSQIQMDTKTLQLRCGTIESDSFIPCCASTFSFNSGLLTGPARCNLKTYKVSQNGNSLYISN